MGGYKPLKITGYESGLVQSRENFILPDDAYPVLENAYVWRERIKRKQGTELLGRLQRCFTNVYTFVNNPSSTNNLLRISGYISNVVVGANTRVTTIEPHNLSNGNTAMVTNAGGVTGFNGAGFFVTVVDAYTFDTGVASGGAYTSGGFFFSGVSLSTLEPNAEIVPGSVTLTITAPAGTFTDNGDGTLTSSIPGGSGTINYVTGEIITTGIAGGLTTWTASFCYNPGFPVMGLRSRELNGINNEELIAFDQVYAYRFAATQWEEFVPGYKWTGLNSDFFWSTNYWVGVNNNKIFWVTNFSGVLGDLIRYTNGTNEWVNFTPQVDSVGTLLNQCLALLPFRGRMLAFNTFEGTTLALSLQYRQRIRWCAIGNPFTTTSNIITSVNTNAWRDDIAGQGGFLDIPTAENITAVGFVRDNLVIYCERSTWQLRYTGRSIAPFQIEKVNTELGSESTFSAVQFDTSLVGVGDKGIVECDSFASQRIDIKIPDLVYRFNNRNSGTKRVHGIRDIQKRLAYWTYPYESDNEFANIFPNRRLVYNYENQSWAIFTDSFTTFGTYQPQTGRTWALSLMEWQQANFTWVSIPALYPALVAGNQQGYVHFIDAKVTNDVSLSITGITANFGVVVTSLEIINHNLQYGTIIEIVDILGVAGVNYTTLNNEYFAVVPTDSDNVDLYTYNVLTREFDLPRADVTQAYIGGGKVIVRDNFRVVSKKFNFIDDGQNIQLGYVDVLFDATSAGAVSLYVYNDYNDTEPANTTPQNVIDATDQADTFFNSVVPTYVEVFRGSTKNWQRVFCAVRSAFITLEWTFSNLQMIGSEQESDVQIDAQILWVRPAGRQLPIGN